ncbi:MBL fold metallo-hydrolase [Streptomyces puniciscabiei]
MHFPLSRPRISEFVALRQPSAPPGHVGVHVTWFGVSSLLIGDGTTSIMIDGFFSRPGVLRVLATKIGPDATTVARALKRAGIDSLAAVICAHSHYDHALDSALVAQLTGATLVGSQSTANLGRGSGMREEALLVPVEGQPLHFGDFTVELIASVHSPNDRCPGAIDVPLAPPARVRKWATGTCWSIIISHGGSRLLVQASTNYIAGALAGREVDVVYLGVGTLGRLPQSFREGYWEDVVAGTNARRVVPVHWDDFFRSSARPLLPMRYAVDDFGSVLRFLVDRGKRDGVDVAMPVAWRRTAPFADLPQR